MKEGPVILVVDDEIQIRRFLKLSLNAYGYSVYDFPNGKEGLYAVPSVRPDLIILDLGLPDMDGLDFVRQLREWSRVPVIILTVKDSEEDKIKLLESGADDYLTKPFGMGELHARIKVALRHSAVNAGNKEESVFESEYLKIDYSKRLVYVDDREIKLTPTEYSLLVLLSKNCGKVITQNQIMRELWGPNLVDETQYLRIYVLQLRKKIERDPSNPKKLITEPGVGYRLV
jgi:two-component system, OmpR family, KDP operon response regulator KdpE